MGTADAMDLQQNMHQLVFEVLENALEGAREGYCTKIEVILLSDDQIKIVDNGRGLPLTEDLHASKAVLEKVLAGKPITNEEYSQMGDLTQAGMQTVNSLSDTLQIAVNRGGRQYRQDYIRGIAQHDLRISDAVRASGTEIVLKPDQMIFGTTSFSKDLIADWIKEKSKDIANLEIRVYGVAESSRKSN